MFNANKYKTIINIAEVNSFNIKDKVLIKVKTDDNKIYSHWVDEKTEGWEQNLLPGVKLSVYVVKKPNKNPKFKNFPYLNIYPDNFMTEPLGDDDLCYEPVK